MHHLSRNFINIVRDSAGDSAYALLDQGRYVAKVTTREGLLSELCSSV